MNINEAPTQHHTFDAAELHWQSMQRWLNPRCLAFTFILLSCSLLAGLSVKSQQIEQFYYKMNEKITFVDPGDTNTLGDFRFLDYLAASRQPGEKECAILGASLIATSIAIKPQDKLQHRLEPALEELSGERWQVANLAANGITTWSMFYMARLLRLKHPPDVLVVSLDAQYPRDRDLQLVLDVGVPPHALTARELAPTLPLNRQPLYVQEANAKRWLSEHVPLFHALTFAVNSNPTRGTIGPWLRLVKAWIEGAELPQAPYPSYAKPDGSLKNWRERPEQRARIEFYNRNGFKEPWNDRIPAEYEQLFAELQRCQQAGIRVIVIATPYNPAVTYKEGKLGACMSEGTARHGLEFHNYAASKLIPEEYYVDARHFFGKGSEIMGRELARLILTPAEARK